MSALKVFIVDELLNIQLSAAGGNSMISLFDQIKRTHGYVHGL
jgi:hypothetical protein